MKLNTKQFKEALNNTLQFVEQKSTIEANTYLIFKAKGNSLTISAQGKQGLTSSYIELENNTEDFSFMIASVSDFSKITNTIIAKEFNFTIKDNLLTIKSGRKEFKLGTLEYEAISYKKNDIVTKLENIDFKALQSYLSITNQFSGSDDLRPIMNGVQINKDHFIATDANMLYKIKNELLKNIENPITINKGFIYKLLKVKLNNFVNIIITNKTLTVQSVNFVTTTVLVEGNYPNYRSIIPNHGNSILIDKLDFQNSLKDALIASSHFSALGVMKTEENTLVITSKDIDFQKEFKDEVELADLQGDDLEIGFSITNMLNMLNVIEDQEIVIQYGGKDKAMVIHGSTSDEETLGLVMPMLVN